MKIKPQQIHAKSLPQIEPLSSGGLLVRAPAKINIDLLIGGKRPDGFHPVDSIVSKITFYDQVEILPREDKEIVFSCDSDACGPMEKNLAYRAAMSIHAASSGRFGAEIKLSKRIPAGMGLGGGSSDAAAVLMGLHKFWNLALSDVELSSMAAGLGSDCPLFLGSHACRMSGRGEVIESATLPLFFAVLCMPPFGCPTKDVYAAFDKIYIDQPSREFSRDYHDRLRLAAPSRWGEFLRNDLQAPAIKVRQELSRYASMLESAAGRAVCMTGSGSGLFVLADELSQASAIFENLPDLLAENSIIVASSDW